METIRREIPTVVRALDNGKISGTASVVFNGDQATEYNLYGNVWERIAPGAFDEVLRKQPDVIATLNHDPNQLLGRTPNTLTLRADSHGLHYELDLPDTTLGNDVRKLVLRGDLRGSSFSAVLAFSKWTREGDREIRTLSRFAALNDVSIVAKPAYGGTKVVLRSQEVDEIERERKEWLASEETKARIEKARSLLSQ